MAENVPPATTVAPANSGNAATSGANTDQSSTRGVPYYEKLRRELRDTIQKKRLMDKNMVRYTDAVLFWRDMKFSRQTEMR